MGVQTQIDRLASAKAAIKTAIEGKGVTVADSAKLDTFAALIDSIEAGGSANVTAGTITVTSDTNDFILTHGLGEIPAFFAIGMASAVPANKTYILIGGFGFGNINVQCRISATASSNAPSGRLDTDSITNGGFKSSFDNATAQTITLACSMGSMKLVSGVTYYWIAAGSGAF